MPENSTAAFTINPNVDALTHYFMIHYPLHNRLHVSIIGPDTNIITTNKRDRRIAEETLYFKKNVTFMLDIYKTLF